MMQWVFWSSILLIGYSYLLYPCLLVVANAVLESYKGTSESANSVSHKSWGPVPHISVVVAAYNEESTIGHRLENLLAQIYAADKLTIFVGSDGSTDKTNEILNSFAEPRVNVRIFSENRGKASVLNDLVAQTTSEIVVFTDANTEFADDATSTLVRHFSDPRVGAVSGELRLRDENSNTAEGVYWSYEQSLKRRESLLDALLGANGAIYAIRRELFKPLSPDTVVDDFQVVMQVAKDGYSVIYDPEAMAWEDAPATLEEEMARRIRIGAGNYQGFFSKCMGT